MNTLTWPEGFCNIGGKTFEWTYDNKPLFVKHTLQEMNNATGLFCKWQKYCRKRVTTQ